MNATIRLNNRVLNIDLSKPIDISIPLKGNNTNVNVWYLDSPISNSGRVRTMLLAVSEKHQFNWTVELVNNPDKVLVRDCKIVVSSDGWVIDHAENWFNLGSHLIQNELENLNILEF